jgi:hypothetical protein
MKAITFKAMRPASAEEWVQSSGPLDRETALFEPMKRFTIDVPVELHKRVKAGCAQRGVKMCDLLRELLEREFPAA